MANSTARKDHWSTEAYSSSASFVPILTTRVVSLLDPQPTDSILDIGCGDGALTTQLAAKCDKIVGLDASPAFVEAARAKAEKETLVGKVEFFERDCRRLEIGSQIAEGIVLQSGQFDKVFSNATLHWVLRDEATRTLFFSDVSHLIRPGGCFVFEMGGAGNVAEIHTALVAVLHLNFRLPIAAIHAADPWFFPSEDWIRDRLAEAGFKDVLLETEYRPTKLDPTDSQGGGGLAGWVRLMGAAYLDLLASEEERAQAIEKVVEVLGSAVTREDGSQWLGYVRLRAQAWVR